VAGGDPRARWDRGAQDEAEALHPRAAVGDPHARRSVSVGALVLILLVAAAVFLLLMWVVLRDYPGRMGTGWNVSLTMV